MHQLVPVVFNDAWGSHVSLASLRGQPIPSALPESELWMGAHEAGPAGLHDTSGLTLADLIAQDPGRLLGAQAGQFGGRLPFLLKVLAPGKAISIQVHPTQAQARWQRELTGDEVYADDRAKPELLLALAPFEVFVGLRSFEESASILRRLSVPLLLDYVDRAAKESDPVHALLTMVLQTPPEHVADLSRLVVAACVGSEGVPDEFGSAAAAIVGIAEDHPDDIGLAVLLLMHHRVLQPGEFIDVAAGVLHSYVRGLGIEVLANSDNVVRAGLTAKPVHVDELLRIVDVAADGVAGRPVRCAPGVWEFVSASQHFRLFKVLLEGPVRPLPGSGPRVAFCLRGSVTLTEEATGERCPLTAGESVFIGADEDVVEAGGSAEVYVASGP